MDLNIELLGAIGHGTTQDVRGVLRLGANPNAEVTVTAPGESDGVVTPLVYIIFCTTITDRELKAQLLIDAGARVTDRIEGFALFDFACKRSHYSVARILLSNGADVDGKNYAGFAPLHLAAWEGDDETCLFLLQNGAEVNIKSEDGGNLPLHSATLRGHLDTTQILLENGAGVNETNNDSLSALHLVGNDENLAKLFFDYGADLSSKTELGNKPLDIAIMLGHQAVTSVLMEAHGRQLLACDDIHPAFWAHVLAKVGERSTDLSRVGICYSLLCEKPDLFGYKYAGRKRKRPDRFVPGV